MMIMIIITFHRGIHKRAFLLPSDLFSVMTFLSYKSVRCGVSVQLSRKFHLNYSKKTTYNFIRFSPRQLKKQASIDTVGNETESQSINDIDKLLFKLLATTSMMSEYLDRKAQRPSSKKFKHGKLKYKNRGGTREHQKRVNVVLSKMETTQSAQKRTRIRFKIVPCEPFSFFFCHILY